jgi:hypothetical protein
MNILAGKIKIDTKLASSTTIMYACEKIDINLYNTTAFI